MFWHKMYNNKMRKEVTIMSVYYSSETRMLQELNKALTDRLNPGNNHTWLFAENSKEKIKINPVQFPDVNTKVFPGVAGWREDVISFLRGSFNHAGGLQTLLPYVAFMAMDLSRVDKSTLDFNPIHSSSDIFHRIKKKILGKRANINTRRDTSSKIFERYHKTHASECIQPVFSGKIGFFDKILPDSLSFVPHKKDYFVREGFSKFGLPDFGNLYNWEEYFYRGKPYAFHMQGSKEKKDMAREGKAVKEFIEKIISNQQQ